MTAGRTIAVQAGAAVPAGLLPAFTSSAPLAGIAADLSGASLFFGFSQTCLFKLPFLVNETASSNPPLWTISVEIWGSFLILCLSWARGRSLALFAGLFVLAFGIFGSGWLGMFLFGHCAALVADRRRDSAALGIAMIAGGFFLAGYRPEIGAAIIFAGIMAAPPAQRALTMKGPQWLGRLSFSIYLLHWPIMITAGSSVYMAIRQLGPAPAAVAAFCAGTALTIAAAWVFERHIDRTAIVFSRAIKTGLRLSPKEMTPAA